MASKKINFYIMDGGQQHWISCSGYPLVIDGIPFKFATHKRDDVWYVTNLETGGYIGKPWKTRRAAEDGVRERIAKFGFDMFAKVLNETVKRNGNPPMMEDRDCE